MQKEFVLFAGHELKTPVTVMKASLDMLEREGIHSKYLDYAAEENEKMRKLVIELLDYSKMEYQEEKSFRESVNFSQCIGGISLEFEAMAFEKAVILITDIQQNLVIDGNKEMLERMAETLLENAIRHTEAGKEVKIVLKKDEKRYGCLWKTRARLFQRKNEEDFLKNSIMIQTRKRGIMDWVWLLHSQLLQSIVQR